MLSNTLIFLFLVYIWFFVRGFVWLLHAIFVIGSVLIQVGVDVQKTKPLEAAKILLQSIVAIPALGILSLVSKSHFKKLRETMVGEMMKSLIPDDANEHVRNVFEKLVRANLGI